MKRNLHRFLFVILALICSISGLVYSIVKYSDTMIPPDRLPFDISLTGFFIFMGLHFLFVLDNKILAAFSLIVPTLFWILPRVLH